MEEPGPVPSSYPPSPLSRNYSKPHEFLGADFWFWVKNGVLDSGRLSVQARRLEQWRFAGGGIADGSSAEGRSGGTCGAFASKNWNDGFDEGARAVAPAPMCENTHGRFYSSRRRAI